ncbi:MAG: glycosyl hydrolase [Armatimonadota bacterium]|nr:glycosyl hydrolase [Armatimonadota bacterium]
MGMLQSSITRILAATVLLAVAWQPLFAAGYIPAEGCYVGAYIELDEALDGDIGAFEELVGKPHATYFRYVGYGAPFPFRWVRELHARGILPHIAWEPNGGLEPVRDDDYLRGWAEAAARTEGPIFLRYASEMNGTWQAYSGHPQEYIRKWRLVASVFRELAPNVILVWCPFATPQATIEDYYPGDEWVDWVGVNIYSVHHYDGDITKPSNDDPRELLRYVYDRYAGRKPIAICEYAATHYCAACGRDVTDMALRQMTRIYEALPTRFPRVKMINWFCVDAIGTGLASNNYSLTGSSAVLERYRRLIADPWFLGRVPDVSEMVAALPPMAPERQPAEAQPAGPLELPPATEPLAPEEPGGGVAEAAEVEPPPTEHPLALARLGPVARGGLDVAIRGAPPHQVTGQVEIVAEAGAAVDVDIVMFYLDGEVKAMTNQQPFRCSWDTQYAAPGPHQIRVVALNSNGNEVVETTVSAIVAEEPDA